jgi:F-type H+-transporting ATPase subunit b
MKMDWWTLGLQTINVVVLIGLLRWFFWRPVANIIAQRQAAAQKTIADAAALAAKAKAAEAEITTTRAGFAGEREAILAKARTDAEQASKALVDQAHKDAAAIDAAEKAAVTAEQQAAKKAWADRSAHLAVTVAQRLASRLDGPQVQAAFLSWLIKAIEALPEPERAAMAAQTSELEVVSANDLTPDEQAEVRTKIGKALGNAQSFRFKTDPALIAGLELHGPHFAVANSWHADLDSILAELAHDH